MDSKGVLISGTNRYDIPDNPAAEEIGKMLHSLTKLQSKWGVVIKHHYTNDESRNEKAARLNLPRRTYRHYLLKAEKWLDRRLHNANAKP